MGQAETSRDERPRCPLCGQPTEEDLDLALLTREAAAKRIGVGMNKLDEWSWEPGFPIIREPHFVRIHIDRLIEWLGERAAATNPPPRRQPIQRRHR
jgi:hypothetical protein